MLLAVRGCVSEHDILVVGAGCVGCSVARSLAQRSDRDIAVVEKEHQIASHQSGRNSGVLHPGFNYEPGSVKAEFATQGTQQAKEYAAKNDIPLAEHGVVVVAQTPAEERRLEELEAQANQNGVETELIHGKEAIKEHEPHAEGRAALVAPEAASIDAQEYVHSLARDAKKAGVDFYTGARVDGVQQVGDTFHLDTTVGELRAEYIVNSAGVHADRLADEFDVGENLQIVPFRGEYYEVVPDKREVCESMIYPTPDPDLPFLGVHYTRRTDDKVIVGPNAVLALGREAYTNTDLNIRDLVEILGFGGFYRLMLRPKMLRIGWEELNKSYRKEKFVEAAQRLVPSVTTADFRKSYAGVRAQLVSDDGRLVKEPLFEHTPQSTHVLNAVSPGLTCSLPFGETLSADVLENFADRSQTEVPPSASGGHQ